VKLGLISDVHADPVALELAWAHLTVLGADRIVCAGDVVGYGPFPDRVVEFLTGHEIATVRGNHDRWALERGSGAVDPYGDSTPSDATLEFLARTPFDMAVSCGNRVGVVVHGSPRDDMEFVTRKNHPPNVLRDWLTTLDADFLVVGHTHLPMWYRAPSGRLVINPGSVISAPRVKTSRTFALLDLDSLGVTFHDVESGAEVEVAPWEDSTEG
jgi:putative phosphoesterase